MVLRITHPMTTTVWPTMKRPVPRKRAMLSDRRPNTSASYRAPTLRVAPRGVDRSPRSPSGWPGSSRTLRPLPAPADGQEPVEHVVDGDGPEEPTAGVAHRQADQVVG